MMRAVCMFGNIFVRQITHNSYFSTEKRKLQNIHACKVIMQCITLFQRCTHLLYCSVLSRPSKQKLELKSSKTRLLPSRSGVLIEFKSGVFTCNSRVITGLKLDFSPSWGVVKIDVNWMISG